MAKKQVGINEMNKALADMLSGYAEAVNESLEYVTNESVKKGRKLLRERSPILTGDYKKGWTYRREGSSYRIYNKTDWQLTHLLEDGHAGVNGKPAVPAHPHIGPTADDIADGFVSTLVENIRTWT